MFYDLANFWGWLLAALILGGAVGFLTWSESARPNWLDGWPKWAAGVFVLGVLVAILKLIPGRAGLWLETALLFVFFYAMGCFVGGWLRSFWGARETTGIVAVAPVMADAFAASGARYAPAIVEPPRLMPDPATVSKLDAGMDAREEADRLEAARAVAAKAEADRLAAETAANAAARAGAEKAATAAKAAADVASAKLAPASPAAPAPVVAQSVSPPPAPPAPSVAAPPPPVVAPAQGAKPAGLPAPTGAADNLKLIKGIGPKNEKSCNDLGVFHFSQIADWSPDNAAWVGQHIAFPGRVEREHWIPQARLLAAGVDTEHSAGVKSGAIKIDDSADKPLSETEANTMASTLPRLAAPVEGEADHAGARPLGLAAPRGGVADDLKLIKGIGKQNEGRLHGLGVWHFDQISAWTPENVKWAGSYLAFPGRIDREQWIVQARELAAGRATEFSRRVEAGQVKSSQEDSAHGQNNIEIVEPRH